MATTFRTLSQMITVSDVCDPFIGEYDGSLNADSVMEEWIVDICDKKSLDPADQIGLVKQDNKVIGFVGIEDLDADKILYECINTISNNMLISADTPLLYSIHTICDDDHYLFMVLKGNQFIGFINYTNLNKLPFRMCLFTLMMDLEQMLMEITQKDPARFLDKLSKGRLEKAKQVYSNRGMRLDKYDNEYGSKLIDCTNFIDKFQMVKREPFILESCPCIKHEYVYTAEKLRNHIAHPNGSKDGSLPVPRREMVDFIKWAEECQGQLNCYIHENLTPAQD